ncbi:hypothetical protein HDU98_001668 [Podochytrium sp. JEL0797]|nr:hypothetical protein HDU98_001668 [Podochytrium sp. JEL0797]
MSTDLLPVATLKAFGLDNILCDDTEIRGGTPTAPAVVSFGNHNIVHPKCRIVSPGGGSIVFGSANIVEEGVVIVNRTTETLHIGDENIFEAGSVFEGVSVGSGCVIEPKATILPGTSIGDNCVIGTSCTTWRDETIPNDTVIFGGMQQRRTQTARSKEQAGMHLKHVEYLKEALKRVHAQKAGVTQSIGIIS